MVLRIEGERFGRLVAIRELRVEKKKRIWLFDCDCGKQAEIPATFVKRGHTQSCGCLRIERSRESVLCDVTGQRFGRLSVIGRAGFSEAGRVQWSCVCDCGNSVTRSAKNLVNGTAVSCGCRKAEALAENVAARVVDYTGVRFGKLTVVREGEPSASGFKRWVCRCDCGGERTSRHTDLQSGKVISCGCAFRDKKAHMSFAARMKGAAACAIRRARRAKSGGSFTAKQISELLIKQRGRCACCRVRLGAKFHRDHIVSLAQGGTNEIHNIQLLCRPCNLAKGAKDPIMWAQQQGRLI